MWLAANASQLAESSDQPRAEVETPLAGLLSSVQRRGAVMHGRGESAHDVGTTGVGAQ